MISIWEKETFFAPQDVIIVGSGLVGLWSAYFLKKNHPKLKVTVLERGLIPSGASTRNAGFACFGSVSELVADADVMGTEEMLELVEMRFKGLERIHKHFRSSEIGFEMSGGYDLYSETDKITSEQLNNNIDYLNSLLRSVTGSKKTFRLADDKISTFGFAGTKHLVKNNLEGFLHSGKLVQCLLKYVQGMGVQVLNGIEIKSYDLFDQTIELQTNQDISFSTNQLLICTNAFAKDLLPEEDIVPARGQVLLTTPIEKLPFEGTFHSDEGFYYFRNFGNRVLLGGARNKAIDAERTTDFSTSNEIQQELEKYLQEVILPKNKNYQIEHRWAGIMGMGNKKNPIVKQILPNIFCAVRMSGMGVALSPFVAQKVTQMMKN